MLFSDRNFQYIDTLYDIAVHCKCQAELEYQEAGLIRIDSYPYQTP